MLNKIWAAFFIIAFLAATVRAVFLGQPEAYQEVVASTFDMSKTAFEIALGLTGVMCLWLGILKLGEAGGAVGLLTRFFRPLFRKLFPSIPEGHAAEGSLLMNMAANALGLDNAATPIGLRAMNQLQELNEEKETASDDQILFLVINTSSVTILPVTIFTYRAQMGAADPTDVFLPILLATFCSTLAGLLVTSFVQKRNLFDKVIFGYLGGLTLLVGGMITYFGRLEKAAMETQSALFANVLLLVVIISFLASALMNRVAVYEVFVEGAKDGFRVAVGIIPYLVAMLVAIGMFRASGALDLALDGIRAATGAVGVDTRWVEALPTALMKPLSGSGARGMLIETMQTHGADSFAGRLASTVQGSTETTFYVLAVYFGSVGIRKTRHAVGCGLAADFAGVVAAIFLCYFFFG